LYETDWRMLRQGSTDAVIVAVDFGVGRASAGFDDLVPHLDTAYAVVQPVFGPAADAPAGGQLAARLADLSARGQRVRGILGYCAGASLACGLADLVARSGAPRPPAVLFDPVDVDLSELHATFEAATRRFEGVVAAGTLAEIRAAAGAATGAAAGQVDRTAAAAVAAISSAYTRLVRAAGEALHTDGDRWEPLTDHFRAYLQYLALAARTGLPWRRPPGTFVLTSAGRPLPSGWTANRTFPVTRAALLAAPPVAVATSDLLLAAA
jgi:hypothetical protein